MDIKIYPDSILTKKCEDVINIDHSFIKIVEDMIKLMKEADGIGLAAPQVGILKRFFVCTDFSDDSKNKSIVLINPVITSKEGRVESKEGCLSIPGFYDYVYRDEQIQVNGIDLEGNDVTYETKGIQSIVIQHEYDHLDGVLFPERMTPIKRDIFMKKIDKEFKK